MGASPVSGLGQVGSNAGWASTPMGPGATAAGGPASGGDPFGRLGGPMSVQKADAGGSTARDPFGGNGIAPYTGEKGPAVSCCHLLG